MTKKILSIILLICMIAVLPACTKTTDQTPDDTMEVSDTTAPTKTVLDFDALDPNMTETQKAAAQAAQDALDISGYSREKLIIYLEMEGHTTEDAQYAVDIIGADWKAQALETAIFCLVYSPYSYNGMIEYLEYSGFTREEAEYGADNCGADWDVQAVEYIGEYNMYNSFSRDELIKQLEGAGFSHDQAVKGIEDYEESKETEQ